MAKAYTLGIDYGTNSVRAPGRRLRRRPGGGHVRLRLPLGRPGHPAGPEGPPPRPAEPGRLHRRPAGLGATGPWPRPRSEPGFARARRRRHRRRHDRLDAHPGGRQRPAARPRTEVEGQPRRPGLAVEGPHGGRRGGGDHREARPSTRRSTSRRSAARTRPSGSGRRSGTACKVAPDVFAAAYSWVELADYVPARPGRRRRPRERSCAASAPPATRRCTPRPGAACPRRTSWRASTRGWPSCATASSRRPAPPIGPPALSRADWATKLGLPRGHPDRHGRLRRPLRRGRRRRPHRHAGQDHRHHHLRLASAAGEQKLPDVPGICGIVPGSIMPGYYGIEAGQSAVGDILNWWVDGRLRGRRAAPRARSRPRPRGSARASPACWRSTGTTATARSWSTRCSPACWSARRCTPPAPRSTAR